MTPSLSSAVSTQMAHSRRQSRRCASNLPEGPQIHPNLPFDIHPSPGIGKKTNYQHYKQLKRVRPGSGDTPRTINGPILPEQVWWASSQLVGPEIQQRKEVEDKEQVRQNWLQRLRPRRSRSPREDQGHDNKRSK